MLTTVLTPVPLAPEISLHLAGPGVGLFDATGGEYRSDRPPPFWAFAWAGGQALARFVLDHPEVVRGRRVLDLATGSGLAAIAAARVGAAAVTVQDVDPDAVAAAHRNAAANGVTLTSSAAPPHGSPATTGVTTPEVVLAGDAFYTAGVAEQMRRRLVEARDAGARVLVGDPGRGYFPERLFRRLATFTVPVPAALEQAETLITSVWEMRNTMLSATNKL